MSLGDLPSAVRTGRGRTVSRKGEPLMKRPLVALFALTFMLAGCAGTSTSSLPTVASSAIPSLASAAADALCDAQSPASLNAIAGHPDTLRPTADPTAVEANLATLLAQLQASNV